MLEVTDVVKYFGGLVALGGVSLRVEAGSVTAVIGPNGSGKTTLFQVVSGLLAADAGTVTIAGEDVTHARPEQIARRGVGRAFQIVRPMSALSVRENLLPGLLYGAEPVPLATATGKADDLLALVGLEAKADVAAADLTLWEKKSLEVARALSVGTRLLLLDEVFAGLSPADVDRMIGVVQRLRERTQATIVLVEHVMRATMALAEEIVVLSFGEVIASGPPERITRHPEVVEVYLGAGHRAADAVDPNGAGGEVP